MSRLARWVGTLLVALTAMPSVAASENAVAAAWPIGDACNASLVADLGEDVAVVEGRCADGWALVASCVSCEGGDTWRIARFSLDADRWELVVAFPLAFDDPVCHSDAIAAGAPALVADRVVWPCQTPPPIPLPIPMVGDTFPLGIGSSGPRVDQVQRALSALGYGVGDSGIDGRFGPDTADAVRAWEATQASIPNGRLSEHEFDALVAAASSSTVASPEPVPTVTVRPTDPASALRNGFVPSICDHPAGTLVDGSLPLVSDDGEDLGYLTLDEVVIGTIGDDPRPMLLAVFGCSHGGVSWPSELVLFDAATLSPLLQLRMTDLWPEADIWRGAFDPYEADGVLGATMSAESAGASDRQVFSSHLSITTLTCVTIGDLDTGDPYDVSPLGGPCPPGPAAVPPEHAEDSNPSTVPCATLAHRDVAAEHDAVWEGEVVRLLQQHLLDLGFGGPIAATGGADGRLGTGTMQAFEAYRAASSLDLGGYIFPLGDHGWLITADALPLIGVDCR